MKFKYIKKDEKKLIEYNIIKTFLYSKNNLYQIY